MLLCSVWTAPPLSLLLVVAVATAAGERGLTCRQEIPAKLLQHLWTRSRQLISNLPKEEKSLRYMRLLPDFCTNCPQRAIGWLELREMIDIYQKSVFSRDLVQRLLPLHYNDLLYRLQHTLQHCVSSSEPSKWFKSIRKLGRKIKKKRRDEVTLKAVREFTFILRWISELAHHRIMR